MSIFKGEASENLMRDWYDRFAAALPYDHSFRTIETCCGDTNVLETGPEDGLPVVLLHGALAGAPHALSQTGDLAKDYRVHGVDIVGQSVRSAQYRPNPNTDEYGRWMVDVLDGLGLEQATLWGVSWGGFVAQRVAAYAPHRVKALMLLNSAGIINGSVLKAMREVSLPMMLFRLFPSPDRRDRAFSAMFTETDPELWSPFMGDAMKHVKMDFSLPPLANAEEFAALEAPVLVHAADQDIQFPGEALLERACELFPNLQSTHLLRDCKHCPPFDPQWTDSWIRLVRQFLEKEVRPLG